MEFLEDGTNEDVGQINVIGGDSVALVRKMKVILMESKSLRNISLIESSI